MLGVIWVTALAWVLSRRLADGYPAPITWTVVVLAVAFVVVVVAELAPKALGMQRSAPWASRVGLVVLAWRTLLTPVVAVAAAIGRVAERILPPVPQPSLDSEDIRTMVAETTERSELESGEREMITSIFGFGETTVREVMTPRTDLVAVEASTPLNEIVASVRRVSAIIGEITGAAREQSSGIGQVHGAVSQLDQVTQQNAALVEQSAAAAESLQSQAVQLTGTMSRFRLN